MNKRDISQKWNSFVDVPLHSQHQHFEPLCRPFHSCEAERSEVSTFSSSSTLEQEENDVDIFTIIIPMCCQVDHRLLGVVAWLAGIGGCSGSIIFRG
eukprot:scaffold4193_cov164-Skeletonema_marinoi.AAC.2